MKLLVLDFDGVLNSRAYLLGKKPILDDGSDMAHLSDRLVKTEFATGLLEAHVDRAIEMLRAPPPLLVTPSPEDVERLVRFT